MAKIPFTQADVWNLVQNNVAPDANGNIDTSSWNGSYATFIDSAPGGNPDLSRRAFVLFASKTSNALISGLLTFLKSEEIPCGFNVRQAFLYKKVFLVDLNQTFPNNALLLLQNPDTQLIPINKNTANDIRKAIKKNL